MTPGAPWGYPGATSGGYPDAAAWYGHWRQATKPLWIIATVLGFIFWWPVGLALLFFSIGSRRMGCWGRGRRGFAGGGWQDGGAPPWANWKGFWCGGGGQTQAAPPTSGNRAFDEYRAETLRRLEEEQKEFGSFLDRLRFAKDKAEFDQFMAELRQRPASPPEPSSGPSAQV